VNRDQVKGRMNELAGKTKKAAGKVARDSVLRRRGRMQEMAGRARATYGDIMEEINEERKKQEGNE
jgi:uncharacterized protein YjbJ (UPF0337 family)